MKRPARVASAPAKIILFGEHFVVYGTHALLSAINRGTTARAQRRDDDKIVINSDIGASAAYTKSGMKILRGGKKAKVILEPIHDAIRRAHGHMPSTGVHVELTSDIPHGVGLGSSAASCVATIAAVDSLFGSHGRSWICERAVESERLIHKNSSGADCYVSTFGGIMGFSKAEGYKKIKTVKQLRLVVGSTGILHSTGMLVERVGKFRASHPTEFKKLSDMADEICASALQAIELGNVEMLGELISQNQRLLREIGVSHSKAELLINLSLNAGALGAKITGAGGGGAIIALARSAKDSARIAAAIREQGYDSIEVQTDCKGLVLEKQA
jgi:mevalonate kinase